MGNRFSYVRYDSDSQSKQARLRAAFEQVEALVDELLSEGRAKSLVHTHLEISYMWTGKAIRDAQIDRTGAVDEQPERNNE